MENSWFYLCEIIINSNNNPTGQRYFYKNIPTNNKHYRENMEMLIIFMFCKGFALMLFV